MIHFLTLFNSANAQDHAPGAVIEDAITVNVTRDGLDAVGGVVGGFLPTDPIALDPVDLHGGVGFCLEYEFGVDNVLIDLAIDDVTITPTNGELLIDIEVSVSLNSSSNPFVMSYDAICFIDGDCDGHVTNFPISASLPLGLDIVPGPNGNTLDATLGQLNIVNGLDSSNIQLDGCAIDTINEVLHFFGIDLYGFVIDFAEDFLIDEINNQVGAIETTIEDAFAAATVEESFEILPGTELHLMVQPNDLDIYPEGLALTLEASLDSDPNDCVETFDPGGSPATAGIPTGVGQEPAGTHVGVHVTDDLVNQATYAVWRSGVLCQELEGEAGGFTLDSNLLGLLAGDEFSELFDQTEPLVIRTVPMVPLQAEFGGAHQIDVPVQDVDLRMYSRIDGRQARVLSVAVSPDIGVDLEFDGSTGELAAAIELGAELRPRMTGDLFVPGSEQEILDSFEGVLGGIIDGIVGDLLSDAVSFDVPSLDGFGLTSMIVESEADVGLGVLATVGDVQYTSAGCDESGGDCGGAGCSSTGGASWLFLGIATLLARRRRD